MEKDKANKQSLHKRKVKWSELTFFSRIDHREDRLQEPFQEEVSLTNCSLTIVASLFWTNIFLSEKPWDHSIILYQTRDNFCTKILTLSMKRFSEMWVSNERRDDRTSVSIKGILTTKVRENHETSDVFHASLATLGEENSSHLWSQQKAICFSESRLMCQTFLFLGQGFDLEGFLVTFRSYINCCITKSITERTKRTPSLTSLA